MCVCYPCCCSLCLSHLSVLLFCPCSLCLSLLPVMFFCCCSLCLSNQHRSPLCKPVYVWNLYLRSTNVPPSPLLVGGLSLYLCAPASASCCSVAIVALCVCLVQGSSLCEGSSPCPGACCSLSVVQPVADVVYWSSPCRDHCPATMKSSSVLL